MPTVQDIRTSIDQNLDRWEAAASATENSVNSSLNSLSDQLETQKSKAAEMSDRLKQAVMRAQDLPSEAKSKITSDLDNLKVQLALGKAETRDAINEQKEKIQQAVQDAEKQIDQVNQNIEKGIEEDLEAWVRAGDELIQNFELAAMRYDSVLAEERGEFYAKKQEMIGEVKQFRDHMKKQQSLAMEKGSAFASDMAASFDQVKSAFRNLTS